MWRKPVPMRRIAGCAAALFGCVVPLCVSALAEQSAVENAALSAEEAVQRSPILEEFGVKMVLAGGIIVLIVLTRIWKIPVKGVRCFFGKQRLEIQELVDAKRPDDLRGGAHNTDWRKRIKC